MTATQGWQPPTQTAPQPPRKPRRRLAAWLTIGGALTAIAGFLIMNTQLILAYKGGTLANVHGLCQGPLVALGGQKLMQECAGINGWYTFAQVALLGGLLASVAGIVLLVAVKSASAGQRPG